MGLLIVNADDLGYDRAATDAILDCFEAGRISSASEMVWMNDSERAAELAGNSGLPTRLHLNLTEAYTADRAPSDARRNQRELAEYFGRARFAYWFCDPRLQAKIEAVIRDQMREFERLHGQRPTALDGHQHVHSCANVLLSPSLKRVEAVRSTFTFSATEKGWVNRTARALSNWVLRRRFKSTRWFGSLHTVDSRIEADRLAKWVARAQGSTVELMTHPGWNDDFQYLMSSSWQELIASARLGSFDDLCTQNEEI